MTTPSERVSTRSGAGVQLPSRWTRVRKVALIRREVRESLPASTIELLLSEGDIVIEGGAELGKTATRSPVFASLMVTTDLASFAGSFREPPDAATAARVAELLDGHADLTPKLVARLRPHLPDLAGCSEAAGWSITVESTVRAHGTAVLVDADIVAAPEGVEVG